MRNRIRLIVVVALPVALVVAVAANARIWDWRSGMLSRRSYVFTNTYYRTGYGSGAPSSLGFGKAVKNTASRVGNAIVDVSDRYVNWLEKKVSDGGTSGDIAEGLLNKPRGGGHMSVFDTD